MSKHNERESVNEKKVLAISEFFFILLHRYFMLYIVHKRDLISVLKERSTIGIKGMEREREFH